MQSTSVYNTYKMETFFMNTIMNTKNSKTNEPNRFKYDLIDKLDFKNPNKNMALANLSIYYTWKNVKSIYKNNKFKISAPTWNETFDLPDGSYNISEIQDYIEYIIKKHETIGENAPILIYANTINNRIVFKIKSRYKLELLSKETMKLLGSTKDIIDTDKNSENVPRFENVKVVLLHCNLVNNSYQQRSKVLFTFVPTKQYGQLISISPHSLVILKMMETDFSEIEVWFTDQNNNALEIEDNVNISLKINTSYLLCIIIKMRYSLEPHYRRYVQGQGFMSFARNIGNKYGKKIFDESVDVGKCMKKKYGKKILDNSLSAAKDFAKTAGKKVLTKSAEATGDLIHNKIADIITKSTRNKEQKEDDRIMEETQKIIIPPEKREQIIKDLKLF